jgi:ubiquinone/menaquinone biosynthesis C-methylase UbiE
MGIEALSKSAVGKFAIRILGAGMESRFRYRFFGPAKILAGADMKPEQIVLEIGCGTGYFTLPAAQLIGARGQLVAIDILAESVEFVNEKVRAADLNNVRVIKADALNTGLDAESFDMVLLFGVIPAPMLPLDKLLAEIHRVLKVGGVVAVWPPIPGWLPRAITKSGLFAFIKKCNSVRNFKRL